MTRTITAAIVVILALAAVAAPRSSARQIVEIRVRGYYFTAPATVPVTVAVEPGADNRMLVVEADSENYFRSSAIELAGESEKRLHTVEFKSLPEGRYEVRAQVRSRREVLATAAQGLMVTGVSPER